MIEGNSVVVNENLVFKFCNEIIKENNKVEKEANKTQLEKSNNDTCLKMIDYLMF
ncbi:hypothetical protein [Candidatus Clostridium radicumherbarum]|uniref:Uncharacterized protein n=1 Tax=Candidatus Clostridium radicumherbarum TaxID=3381662 RepID=A0ABW8TQX4_9CLOT